MLKIDPEDWKEWKDSRVTQAVLKYLSDFVSQVGEAHKERFLQGHVIPEIEQIRESAKCIAYMDVADIELDQVLNFYKEEDNADEATAR